MYYPHFGLKEPPFKITPNTDFFFSGGNRGAVLDALVYAIVNGEGIIKVVGEVGSGKTMLCRMLQTILPEKIESIYLANPSVAPEDVLDAIAFELQLKVPKTTDRLKVMQILQAHLLKRHAEGRQVVIFVEEAQGMPLATLEEIRLLSNLETKQDKLLQIVLFGQPELDINLNETHIRQLRERITHSFHLGPLQTKDIGEYLIFRLRAAGYHGPHLFTDPAIRKLSKAAEGLVRRVNILADKALLAAFAENAFQVTPKHIKAAIQDSEFSSKSKHKKYWLLAALLLGLSGLTLAYAYKTQRISIQPEPPHTAKPAVALEKKPSPTITTPANVQQSQTATSIVSTNTPNPSPSAISHAEKADTADKNTAAPAPNAAASADTKTSPSPTAQAGATATLKNTEAVADKVISPDKQNAKPSTTVVDEKRSDTPASLLDSRFAITKDWLSKEPAETTTLQIKSLRASELADEGRLKAEFDLTRKLLGTDKLYLYNKKQNGEDYTVILYGAFKQRSDALNVLKKLPSQVQNNKPYLRTLGGINKEIQQEQ